MIAPAPLPDGLKILHILDHSLPLHSGYSFRTRALLREQIERGWRVSCVTTPKHTLNGPPVETIGGVRFFRTPPAKGPGASVPGVGEARLIWSVARRIREVAAAERPDILHAHSPVLNALAAMLAARDLKLPIVYEVRAFWEDAAVANGATREGSLRYDVTKTLETLALRRAAAVVTICNGLADDMRLRRVWREKISLVPNGVDLAAFPLMQRGTPSEAALRLRHALGLDGALVLGFLGSFYAYEGLHDLVAAMPDIRHAFPQARLVLAGGGPEEATLKSLARSLDLEDHIAFLGRIPQDEIVPYFELIDLFVFPRLRSRLTETVTPLKPLEAMATGGIVVASDVGGHRELIHHRRTGYLFPCDGPPGVARGVLEAAALKNDWDALRVRARSFVAAERSWPACAAAYADAYKFALAHKA